MRILLAFGNNEDGQLGIERKPSQQSKSSNASINSISFPSPVQFPTLKISVASISAGSRHTLALSATGQVYSWGWGLLGQLGLGHNKSVDTPVRIEALVDITSISAGGLHSACLDKYGSCFTFGSSSYGQLGLGSEMISENSVNNPTKIPFDVQCTKVSCGGMHTGIIDIKGCVYCFGRADSGQVGYSLWKLKFLPGVTVPMQVVGLDEPAIEIACGGFHTLIVVNSGKVYCMGKDDFGILGLVKDGSNKFSAGTESPTLIDSLWEKGIKIKSARAGGWHSCFISDIGHLYVCGKGEYGRLGTGDETSKDEPTLITMPSSTHGFVTAVSPGGSHSMWTTSSNEVYVAGRTDHGRLGIDLTKQLSGLNDRLCSPQKIDLPSGSKVVQVTAGGNHSLILVETD